MTLVQRKEETMWSSLAPPCVKGKAWSVLILLVTVLMLVGHGSTTSLRKCHCNKEQAWDGSTCIDIVPQILGYIGDSDFTKNAFDGNNLMVVSMSDIPAVTVEELHCPEDFYKRILNRHISVLSDGRLLKDDTMTIFTNDSFCIINYRMPDHITFEAEVCLPIPPVPRCCPENQLLQQDGSCHPREGLQPPLFQLQGSMREWESLQSNMVTLTCNEHENFQQIPLSPGKAEVGITSAVEFKWFPPFFTASHTWIDNFCIGLQETESHELQYVSKFCRKDYDRYHDHQCDGGLCVRKCCPNNALVYDFLKCVDTISPEEVWQLSKIPGHNSSDEWKIVYGEPGCKVYVETDEVKLLPNGHLEIDPSEASVPPSHYCLDTFWHENNVTSGALVCYPEVDESCLWRDIVVKVLLGVSCAFLVATLAVYLGVADLRDHMYGRCLISLVVAMLTAYICLWFDASITHNVASCVALAFVKHFSSLAMFFWLNVMCFEMWKILRGSTMQHHSVKVFVWYSLYAWGCPLVISIVTLALDIAAPENIILPEYYKGSCSFNKDEAYWAYFSGLVMVLLFVNVAFFIHVAVTLYQKMKQRTKIFETNTSRSTNTTKTKKQVWLFIKLFVVMGVVWITDSFSGVSHRNTCSFWIITDIINGLQGVFIFIVAVCNKDNLKKVKNAWRPRLHSLRQTLSTFKSDSSQRNTRNTLSVDDTEASRKTSITSLPRKISLASNIFFSSSKKSATLNHVDTSGSDPERKNSNVSIKEVIPIGSMCESPSGTK